MKSLFYSLILVLAAQLAPALTLQAQQWAPLLPLPKAGSEVLFEAESLRDPKLQNRPITDELFAQNVEGQLTQIENNPAAKLLKKRADIAIKLYESHTRLAYFYEDAQAERVYSSLSPQEIEARIKRHRTSAARHASEVLKLSKTPEVRTRATYHMASSRFLNREAVSHEAVLSLSKKSLDSSLASQSLWLTVLLSHSKTDTVTIKKAISSLSTYGKISAALYFANYSNDYNKILKVANNLTSKLPRQERVKTLVSIISIWQKRSGNNMDWSQVPVNIKSIKELDLGLALSERIALQKIRAREFETGLTFYRNLSETLRDQPRVDKVYDRILELETAQYQATKNPKTYEKALLSLRHVSENNQLFGKSQAAGLGGFRDRLQQRHRQLIMQLLAEAKRTDTQKNSRLLAIRIANTYLTEAGIESEKLFIKSEIAKIYVINGQHKDAVRTYVELKQATKGQESHNFLRLAMHSQRQLAEWPETAPWNGISQTHTEARKLLGDMFEEGFKITGQWDDLAHLGLIQINVKQTAQAFKLWTSQLAKNSQGIQAARASGFMLSTYKQARQWQNLEDLSRLALKVKQEPIFQNQKLQPTLLLADALFEGGKEHFVQHRQQLAANKLADFVKNFRGEARRPEAMFILGQAYEQGEKYSTAVEVMYALVNEYPQGRFYHDALLLGGSWSVPMAWEDQTIFFYQKFIETYTKDAKAPAVRQTLIPLYLGRELYGNAVRVHKAQAEDKQLVLAKRIDSALEVMHIEEHYGEAEQANWGAQRAKELSNNNPSVLAEVLSFEARTAATKQDTPKLKRIESQLSRLPYEDRTVTEALALTRYILAEREAERTKQEIFNLEQNDPYKTLNQQYTIFEKASAAYDKVCAPGLSSYCALAMLRLSEITTNSLAAIENLTIPATLDENLVQQFDKQKLAIIGKIGQTAARADATAMNISEKGETLPEWSKEILVKASEDSFDRSHGAIGNGYIQWFPVNINDE